MRHAVGKINEEGLGLFGADELKGLLGESAGNCGLLGGSLDDLGVAHQRHVEIFDLRFKQ